MRKVIKFKFYYLISNKFIFIFTLLLLFLLNFDAIFNSGILLSGGETFNQELKYTLLINNYTIAASMYGIFFTIALGSMILGPDTQTGNLYVLLSAYSNRVRYYIGSFISVVLYTVCIQILLLINFFMLCIIFNINFLWSDITACFINIILNSLVILAITGLASVYIKGIGSAFIGLVAYSFYSIYNYNSIPLMNTNFIINIRDYRNILGNFMPIVHVLVPSISLPEAFEIYGYKTIIPNVNLYQIIFVILFLGMGCLCFYKKDL